MNAQTSARNEPYDKAPPSTRLSNTLLQSLSPKLYQIVRASMEPVSIKKGDVLFASRQDLDYVYFPESAVFSERVQKSSNEEPLIEIGLIGNEDAAGLIQAYCGNAIANYTIAIKSGTATKLGVPDFQKLIKEHPEFQTVVSHYFGLFSRSLSQRPACFLFHSSKQRFCKWLLRYLQKSKSPILRATHGEIAQCLGIYRPNVTLLTHELSNDNLIVCTRGSLTILDAVRLRLSACGCY